MDRVALVGSYDELVGKLCFLLSRKCSILFSDAFLDDIIIIPQIPDKVTYFASALQIFEMVTQI